MPRDSYLKLLNDITTLAAAWRTMADHGPWSCHTARSSISQRSAEAAGYVYEALFRAQTGELWIHPKPRHPKDVFLMSFKPANRFVFLVEYSVDASDGYW